MSWVAVAVAAIGAGTTLYGANKQAKANAAAQNQNIASQDTQNQAAWGNYLMTRGIAPTSPVQPGVLPQPGGYQVVNTKLPLWATIKNTPQVTAPKRGGFLVPLTGT